MADAILSTKLHVPVPRQEAVRRPRLTERLNRGLHRKLTLISAPAGFGKSTVASEWIASYDGPAAWLSLDTGDRDPARFLSYLVAALRTTIPGIGGDTLGLLQAPQPPSSPDALLTPLLNDVTDVSERIVLVLDDYHLLDSPPVDQAIGFLVEHLPPKLHLVIATREDPQLPLARLRARDDLTELRAGDLRFAEDEAASFLNQAIGLDLSAEQIAALESRTEGWIAGLQLAAISLQGQRDTGGFIDSFTGSHRYVLDYLVEEVLQQQPDEVQAFLLRTSILNRMCGALCDAVVGDAGIPGDRMIQYLEQANLFVIPLDDQRRWYRYHHLFADLLRQRLDQTARSASAGDDWDAGQLHLRASRWFESQELEIEAFQHATAAGDIGRAESLVHRKRVPLHFRGAVAPVLAWLESLPRDELDRRPSLWVLFASALSMTGQYARVEGVLQAAEAALRHHEWNDHSRNLTGHIAALKALIAAYHHDEATIISESERALEYLHPDNLAVRTATSWKLGIAYKLQGNRPAAERAYRDAIAACEASENTMIQIAALSGLGNVQESNNELRQAAESYRQALELTIDPHRPVASEANVGLSRILYEWNDLDAAAEHVERSLQPAAQTSVVSSELMLARLRLAREDLDGAIEMLDRAEGSVRRLGPERRAAEVAALRILALLRLGELDAAERLADAYDLPLGRARVRIARNDAGSALKLLEHFRWNAEEKGLVDERLRTMVLQALAIARSGDTERSIDVLTDVLQIAKPDGFVRSFLDEGEPMAELLALAVTRDIEPDYARDLLNAFRTPHPQSGDGPVTTSADRQPLIEPLSRRETEVLQLIAQGLSNREICERLFLALDTVKGHNRVIFNKLQVRRRTEAVARARELDLL